MERFASVPSVAAHAQGRSTRRARGSGALARPAIRRGAGARRDVCRGEGVDWWVLARVFTVSAIALAALGAAASCREPTEIVVSITTDVRCSDVRGTAITVGNLPELEQHPLTAETRACLDGRIGEIVVVPSGADDGTVAIKVVMAFGRDLAECVAPSYGPGCIVARRALRYIPHTRLRLPILMATACSGVDCGATDTCVGGDCRPATVPDPDACALPGGCNEGTLGPPVGGGGADAGSDAPPPPPPPPVCAPPVGAPCAGTLAPGWSPIAFAASQSQQCPSTFAAVDAVASAVAAVDACVCTCQVSAADPPSCAKGTFASVVGSVTCDQAGQGYTVNGTGCTAIGSPGAVSAFGLYAAFPLQPGTCVPGVQKSSAPLVTDGVRTCVPPPECVEDVCRGAPPPGFASCIVHEGDVPCPGPPFDRRTPIAEDAAVTCGGCESCVNSATCSVATFRFYNDAACATELATRIANGVCNPLATGAAGTFVSRFRYDAVPVGAKCAPTAAPTAVVTRQRERTVCCR
jgi:hypothetical protein